MNKVEGFAIAIFIAIPCIYVICCSLAEIIYYFDMIGEKKQIIKNSKQGKYYFAKDICKLVQYYDILDVVIQYDSKFIHLGSSSDSKGRDSKLFDKLYYIGDKEFSLFDDFEKTLFRYTTDSKLFVVLIDNINPKFWKF